MAFEPLVRSLGDVNSPSPVLVEDVHARFKRHKRILGLAIVERFHNFLRRQNASLGLGESAFVGNVLGLLLLSAIIICEDVLSF